MATIDLRPTADGVNTAWGILIDNANLGAQGDWKVIDQYQTPLATEIIYGYTTETGEPTDGDFVVSAAALPANAAVTQVEVFFPSIEAFVPIFRVALKLGGSFGSFTDYVTGEKVTFTGTWTKADFTDFQVRLRCTGVEAETHVWSMYTRVTYTESSGGGGSRLRRALAFFHNHH